MGCLCSKKKSPSDDDELPRPKPHMELKMAQERALNQLKLIFDSIDDNHDGGVDKSELTTALDQDVELENLLIEAGINLEYKLLEQLDTNHDGRITWDEFSDNMLKYAAREVQATGDIAAADRLAEQKAMIELKKVFKDVDANQDGCINIAELRRAMARSPGLKGLCQDANLNFNFSLLAQLDTNKDGHVTWDEFMTCLRNAAVEEVKDKGHVKPLEETRQQGGPEPMEKDNLNSKGWCCACT